jgi:hypothetical protein
MKIQKPIISQPTITAPTITDLASLEGDGANITGSFSGSFDASAFDSPGLGIVSASAQVVGHLPTGTVSGSAQTVANLPSGTISGSAQLPSGTVSGSAQTVANLPAGTVSGSAQTVGNLPSGTVSGSAQILAGTSIVSASSIAVTAQGAVQLTTNGVAATAVDLGLKTDDNVEFADVTVTGNLSVTGTTTSVNSNTLNIGDNIISLNGTAATKGGLAVNDATGTTTSGSLLWNGTNDYWEAGPTGSEAQILTTGNTDADILTFSLPASTTISAFGKTLVDDADAAAVRTTIGLENVDNTSDAAKNAATATLTNKTIAASQVTEISGLTEGEGEQLENIGTTTISGTQWGYLGASDQAVQTDSDVEFNSFGVGTAAPNTPGEIRATGDITAYYSSDERLKENFAPLAGALDKVKAIGGYEFDWKEGIEDVVSKTGHDIGVKAQELQAQYPELVHERDNGYLAVDYIKLNAVLIEAVKELAAKVEELSK